MQDCQEAPDILSFGTSQAEEGLLQVVLCINALHCEFEDKAVPPCLHSDEGVEVVLFADEGWWW